MEPSVAIGCVEGMTLVFRIFSQPDLYQAQSSSQDTDQSGLLSRNEWWEIYLATDQHFCVSLH